MARAHLPDVKATLDLDGMKDIRNKHFHTKTQIHFLNYLNVDRYLRMNLRRAFQLDLHGTMGKSILDLGTGFGYFPYVCQHMGHEADALDLPGAPLFEEVTALLGVKPFRHRIEAKQPLPDLGRRYDIVTAFQVAFHRSSSNELWDADDWRFLIDDIRERHLKPGGKIFLEINYLPELGRFYSKYTAKLFRAHGGSCRGPRRAQF